MEGEEERGRETCNPSLERVYSGCWRYIHVFACEKKLHSRKINVTGDGKEREVTLRVKFSDGDSAGRASSTCHMPGPTARGQRQDKGRREGGRRDGLHGREKQTGMDERER